MNLMHFISFIWVLLVYFSFVPHTVQAQQIQGSTHARQIFGMISDESDGPIEGATITIIGTSQSTRSGQHGVFRITPLPVSTVVKLSIQMMGYKSREMEATLGIVMKVRLQKSITGLDEVQVYSTGYQKIPKERSTGSFVMVDSALLEKRVGANILDRLNGQVSGLIIDQRNSSVPSLKNVRIRGQGTLYANTAPLVILDDFPYDGDIAAINPNSIENITILRDAAAASIWGVRATNGVIVITTKKGRLNQRLQANMQINTSVLAKSDLTNISMLSSKDQVELEEYLFEKGYYVAKENSVVHEGLSPMVELLIQKRDGTIAEHDFDKQRTKLIGNNIVDDLYKYWYRTAVNQQYALDLRGGGAKNSYLFSMGYDKSISTLDARSERLNLRSENTLKITDRISGTIGLLLNNSSSRTNRNDWSSIAAGRFPILPYYCLLDENGDPLSWITNYRNQYVDESLQDGLLDWSFRPMEDYKFLDRTGANRELIIRTGLDFKLLTGLHLKTNYQYLYGDLSNRNREGVQSFATRNYINLFTEREATGNLIQHVPYGDMLNSSSYRTRSHSFRAMLDYTKKIGDHDIAAITGMDIKQVRVGGSQSKVYGYNDDVLTTRLVNYDIAYPQYHYPALKSKINDGNAYLEQLDRTLSYYFNGNYSYKYRYTASFSVRKDGTNLFGVNANQKFVPLWSTGLSYTLSNEPFFASLPLSYLKLRATYGYNGNVDNTMASYVTMTYVNSKDDYSGNVYGTIRNPPNPDLRWERTAVTNLGLDFALENNRISGTVEVYRKKGQDLIGTAKVDPTTGVTISIGDYGFRGNVASMEGKGLDLTLKSKNTEGILGWTTLLNYSLYKDKVTSYQVQNLVGRSIVSYGTLISPMVGKPLYSMLSYRWGGLDGETGDPQGYVSGELSKSYNELTGKSTLDDLVFQGSAVPTNFGNLQNNFTLKNWELSFNMTFRLGYYFRSSTMSYGYFMTSNMGHTDYAERWQIPGDELYTTVPSRVYPNVANRDEFYQYSEATVQKADNIRLADIRLSYQLDLSKSTVGIGRFLKNVQFYAYCNRIATLWKAYHGDFDPDFRSYVPLQRQVSLGLKAFIN